MDQKLKLNDLVIKAQDCLLKMEIASLARYVFICKAKKSQNFSQNLMFFTPCEELQGGSVFSKLSANYKVI